MCQFESKVHIYSRSFVLLFYFTFPSCVRGALACRAPYETMRLDSTRLGGFNMLGRMHAYIFLMVPFCCIAQCVACWKELWLPVPPSPPPPPPLPVHTHTDNNARARRTFARDFFPQQMKFIISFRMLYLVSFIWNAINFVVSNRLCSICCTIISICMCRKSHERNHRRVLRVHCACACVRSMEND